MHHALLSREIAAAASKHAGVSVETFQVRPGATRLRFHSVISAPQQGE
jgi:hypothetical protein